MKLALFFAAVILSLVGCNGPCLKLAEKLCDCQATSTLRDTCNQQASDSQSTVTVTSADNDRCAALLDKCDCHAIDTVQGKIDCGLARGSDWTQ
jgi:hypothetical protein